MVVDLRPLTRNRFSRGDRMHPLSDDTPPKTGTDQCSPLGLMLLTMLPYRRTSARSPAPTLELRMTCSRALRRNNSDHVTVEEESHVRVSHRGDAWTLATARLSLGRGVGTNPGHHRIHLESRLGCRRRPHLPCAVDRGD